MAKILDARNYIGTGLPAKNGQRLADEVLRHDPATWGDLVIEARGCPPEYLNLALFYAFWQRLFENQPSHLAEGKSIPWEFTHPFQQTIIEGLRARFQPRQPA